MSTFVEGDQTPIGGEADLSRSLLPSDPSPGRMGAEWELLPMDDRSHLVPYAGSPGVESLLECLGERASYHDVRESGRVIALRSEDGAFIGLEPGAQVEVSTQPFDRLDDLVEQLRLHVDRCLDTVRGLDFHLRPWGLAPHNSPEDLEDVPKERYGLLREYFQGRGDRARWMMKLTASVQLSLDYESEEGLQDRIDGALRLLPYLLGWTANAPVAEGQLERACTHRPDIWWRTDHLRCGTPAFLFHRDRMLEAWCEYALNRPALFFVRDGSWISGEGRCFRDWLRNPGALAPLTLEDWNLHNSTLFPDLRIRGYLEIRLLDSFPMDLLESVAAFLKGLLGDAARIRSWRDLLAEPREEAYRAAVRGAAAKGPRWVLDGHPAPADVGPRLIDAARSGLLAAGEDTGRLDCLERFIVDCTCPADGWVLTDEGWWKGPEC